MVALNGVNLQGVEASLGGNVVIKPEGWYQAMVASTKAVGSKDDSNKNVYLEVTFAFQDQSTFINRYNLWHEKEDTRTYAARELVALLHGVGIPPQQYQDSQQMHNQYLELFLTIEQDDYKDRKINVNRLRAIKSKLEPGKVIGKDQGTGLTPQSPTGPATGKPAPAGGGGFAPPGSAGSAGFAPPQTHQPTGAAPAPAAGPAPGQPWGGAPAAGAPAPAAAPAPAPAPAPAAGGWGGPAPAAAPGGFQPAAGPAPAHGGWGGPAQ